MQSKAKTVKEYLESLPRDRREAIEAVRKVILANLDGSYEEGMQYGMIGYYIPHRVYPAGYHCDPKQPVPFACLSSQKNHMSVHLMPVYGQGEVEFRKAWLATGKKLDMGKCCVRFKKVDDIAFDVIGETVRRFPARRYLELYEAMLNSRPSAKGKRKSKAAPSKPTATRSAKAKSANASKSDPKAGHKKSAPTKSASAAKRKRG